MKPNPYGDILLELETGLWEHDYRVDEGAKPYPYTDEQLRACLKIFMSALMWKLWEQMRKDGISVKIGGDTAKKMGEELRSLVLKFTEIDTHKLFKEEGKDVDKTD